MKNRIHFKFKRLILRIVSVISVISILLSSVVISVFAKDYYGYKSDYQPIEFVYGRGYRNTNQGGINGTIISRSYRWSNVNNILRIYTKQNIDEYVFTNYDDTGTYPSPYAHFFIQVGLANPFIFKKGVSYDITFPIIYEWGPRSGLSSENGVYLVTRMNKLSLMNTFGSSVSYYDFWFDHNAFVREDGRLDIVYTIIPNRDFTADSLGFGVNLANTTGTLSVKSIILSSPNLPPLSINDNPVYIIPDFSDQDNNQALEDGIRENGGDAFAQLNNFYESLGHLGDSFEFIKTSMFKSSFIFSTFFTEGHLLSDILYFALVIGLSGFIIGAIGSVASWATGFGGREFGRYRNAKEREANRDFYRRNKRR